MRMESLIQFLVPLTFLAIWALTSLFNRESQSLPPRAARPPGPGGAGGARPTAGSQASRPYAQTRPSNQSQEPGRRSSTPVARSTDDDILILDDTRRPPAVTHRITAANRRSGRNRAASPSKAAARVETKTKRALTDSMNSGPSIASEVAQPKTLSPLVLASSSPLISQSKSDVSQLVTGAHILSVDHEMISAGDFRTLIGSQTRLREALIMSEILQPPLSLRRGGFRRS